MLPFPNDLPLSLCPLLAQGTIVRERLPAESPWRAQRTAALHASDCERHLIPGAVGIVAGYAAVSEEELWVLLEKEQEAHRDQPNTRGKKRKRG